MAWECVRWAIEETRVAGPVYTVLLVLAESAHAESGACRVAGAREIARRAHIADESQVRRYLRELESRELIAITRSSGRRSLYDLTGYITYTQGKIAPSYDEDDTPRAKLPQPSDTPRAKLPRHPGQNCPDTQGKIAPTLSPIDISHRENTHTHARTREETRPEPQHIGSEGDRARAWARTADGAAWLAARRVDTTRFSLLLSAWREAQPEDAASHARKILSRNMARAASGAGARG